MLFAITVILLHSSSNTNRFSHNPQGYALGRICNFYLFAPCLFDLYLTLVLPIHTVAM